MEYYMEKDLDDLLNHLIERHYKRLINVYNKRLSIARDKEFAITQFVKRMMAFAEFRIKLNDDYRSLMLSLEEDYRLGRSITYSINKLRQSYKKRMQPEEDFKAEIVSLDENVSDISLSETKKKTSRYSDIGNFTDEELVRLYAEYQVYEKFTLFLSDEAKAYEVKNNLSSVTNIIPEEPDAKNKEFTTARQVLAMHYLLKYCQVKNVDMTEKARFIQFLTGKNYDNIYKKVQSPLNGIDRYVNEDLKFVRNYFERLRMSEIVKMINNEIEAGKY